MSHPKVSNEEMLARVVRFSDLNKENAIPLMFIDSLLPGHHRLNYAVIGDTASENPDFKPILAQPHNFQIGMFKAMPDGNGPAFHTHDYVEIFFPLEGSWRFWYGNDPKTNRSTLSIWGPGISYRSRPDCGGDLRISVQSRRGALPC